MMNTATTNSSKERNDLEYIRNYNHGTDVDPADPFLTFLKISAPIFTLPALRYVGGVAGRWWLFLDSVCCLSPSRFVAIMG